MFHAWPRLRGLKVFRNAVLKYDRTTRLGVTFQVPSSGFTASSIVVHVGFVLKGTSLNSSVIRQANHGPTTPGSVVRTCTQTQAQSTSPPLGNPPPPRGGTVNWPKKHRKYQAPKKILQGAEADLHCDTVVQICGAIPPSGEEPLRHW